MFRQPEADARVPGAHALAAALKRLRKRGDRRTLSPGARSTVPSLEHRAHAPTLRTGTYRLRIENRIRAGNTATA